MTTDTTDLRIRNCTAADFEFACPKAWANLKPAFSANLRHCDACDRNVYLCHSDQDLELYTSLNYCVAIPANEADGPAPAVPGKAAVARTAVMGVLRREGQMGKKFDEWAASLKPGDIPEFLRKKR